jgi:hypothetical protein
MVQQMQADYDFSDMVVFMATSWVSKLCCLMVLL